MNIMKNEKVALVFFAYIIGFTTAFIAFAIDNNDYSKNDYEYRNKYSVTNESKNEIAQSQNEVEVLDKPEGLFIKRGNTERVLSATAIEGVSGEGFHTEVLATSVSPDGRYVYFCTSLVGDEDVCTSFVYSSAEDMVYRVRVSGESLKTTKEEISTVSWVSSEALRFPMGTASAETNWTIR